MAIRIDKKDFDCAGLTLSYEETKIEAFTAKEDGTYAVPLSYGLKHGARMPPVKDKREMGNISWTGAKVQMYPRQQDILDRALPVLKEQHAIHLMLYCGFGKTKLTIKMLTMLKLRNPILVIVDRDVLIKQWVKEVSELTDARVCDGRTGDNTADVCVITIQSSHFTAEHMARYKTVIVDEVRSFCTQKRCIKLLTLTPRYLIALGADKRREDRMHCMIDLFFGKNVLCRTDYSTFYVQRIRTDFKPTIENHSGYSKMAGRPKENVAEDSIKNCEKRNIGIVRLCLLHFRSRRIIVFTRLVQHAQILATMINAHPDFTGKCVSVTRNVSKFPCPDIICTTFSKLGKGFDIETCCDDYDGVPVDMVIFASSTPSPEQYKGRARGANSVIYDIIDAQRMYENRWTKRERAYKKMGGVINKEVLWMYTKYL